MYHAHYHSFLTVPQQYFMIQTSQSVFGPLLPPNIEILYERERRYRLCEWEYNKIIIVLYRTVVLRTARL